jgi:hypothetical protein
MITFTFCFGLVTLLFTNANQFPFGDSHNNSDDPSIVHLWSHENLEKLLASSYSRALLLASLAACHPGAATTQSVEHHWGLLQRVCHGDLTADGMSSGIFRAIGLRLLCSILSLQHTQPGRARSSGAILPPVSHTDWTSVPPLKRGCAAAFDWHALALRLDPSVTRRPSPFHSLPRILMWPSLQAFLEWLPETPRVEWNSISSKQLPITSQRGQDGVRMSIQYGKLAAAGAAVRAKQGPKASHC